VVPAQRPLHSLLTKPSLDQVKYTAGPPLMVKNQPSKWAWPEMVPREVPNQEHPGSLETWSYWIAHRGKFTCVNFPRLGDQFTPRYLSSLAAATPPVRPARYLQKPAHLAKSIILTAESAELVSLRGRPKWAVLWQWPLLPCAGLSYRSGSLSASASHCSCGLTFSSCA